MIACGYAEGVLQEASDQRASAVFCRQPTASIFDQFIENINFNVCIKWDLLLDLFKFSCETAQAIDCPYVILVPTRSQVANTKDEKQVLDNSVKVINLLADLTKPYGVKLAFEPIGNRCYCCTGIRQALKIVGAVGRDDVGLTVDSFTFYLQEKSANMDVLSRIPRGKLIIYHIADSEDLPLGKQ